MKPISLQTKSFLILLLLAVAGTGATYLVAKKGTVQKPFSQVDSINYYAGEQKPADSEAAPVATKPIPEVSTEGWKEYTDSKYHFSFRYNPAWKISSSTLKNGWYTLVLDPGPKYDNIRIYVSDQGFFAMDSLPVKEETFGSNKVINALDLVYGIKANDEYLTFDLGASLSLQPQLRALVNTVKLAGN